MSTTYLLDQLIWVEGELKKKIIGHWSFSISLLSISDLRLVTNDAVNLSTKEIHRKQMKNEKWKMTNDQ